MNAERGFFPSTILGTIKLFGGVLPKKVDTSLTPACYIKNLKEYSKYELRDFLQEKGMPGHYDQYELVYDYFAKGYYSSPIFEHNYVDFTIWFTDFFINAHMEGYASEDYLCYEFYHKEVEERRKFISHDMAVHGLPGAFSDIRYQDCMNDKLIFNARMKHMLKRDWMDVSKHSFSDFFDFMKLHKDVVCKPNKGLFGIGIELLKGDLDIKNAEILYKKYSSEKILIEERISQCGELKSFNPDTANTIRIISLNQNGNTEIMFAVGRFGRKGQFADNFHNGGLAVLIDIQSGEIVTDAVDGRHVFCNVHPDTGKTFKGFRYPLWDEIKREIKKAAILFPEIGHIGWDISINDKKEIDFIEGNFHPGFCTVQTPDQVGKYYVYEKYGL